MNWCDVDRRTYIWWGDYWVKMELKSAMEKLGVHVGVAREYAQATIYLWGAPMPEPRLFDSNSYNICWFYGHPDKMTRKEMQRYDMVISYSDVYHSVIRDWHGNIWPKVVGPCSNFEPPPERDLHDIDVLFVGNARGGSQWGRLALYWLDPPPNARVQVYGYKWFRPEYEYMHDWYVGEYWPYPKLNQLYGRARITLIDGHEDMQRCGFIPHKVFDTAASNSFVLMQHNAGIERIFGDSIQQFKTKKEMNDKIAYYLAHEDERCELAERAGEIARKHTYTDIARELIKAVESGLSQSGGGG